MTTMVMFRGQQYWIVSIIQVGLFGDEKTANMFDKQFVLRAVEETYVKGNFRVVSVGIRDLLTLPSTLDWQQSEWAIGVRNGQI